MSARSSSASGARRNLRFDGILDWLSGFGIVERPFENLLHPLFRQLDTLSTIQLVDAFGQLGSETSEVPLVGLQEAERFLHHLVGSRIPAAFDLLADHL